MKNVCCDKVEQMMVVMTIMRIKKLTCRRENARCFVQLKLFFSLKLVCEMTHWSSHFATVTAMCC